MKLSVILIATIVGLLTLVIIACGSEATPAPIPPKAVELKLPLGLDPALVYIPAKVAGLMRIRGRTDATFQSA